jgi:hypothetical protein
MAEVPVVSLLLFEVAPIAVAVSPDPLGLAVEHQPLILVIH